MSYELKIHKNEDGSYVTLDAMVLNQQNRFEFVVFEISMNLRVISMNTFDIPEDAYQAYLVLIEGKKDIYEHGLSEHYIKIMNDFSSDGIWELDGSAASLSSLPVPLEILLKLIRWQYDYETIYNPHDRVVTGEENNYLKNEGESIARSIKKHLPDWKVLFYDEVFEKTVTIL